MSESRKVINIFYCYDPEDRPLLNEIDRHLAMLKRQGQVVTWYERDVLPGVEKSKEIAAHLNTAQILVLLVSPASMSSRIDEMKRAMERHMREEAYVIPILLRPGNYQDAPFNMLQTLPSDGQPITTWANHEEALFDVVRGIQLAVRHISAQ